MRIESNDDRRLKDVYASDAEIAGDGNACPSRDALLDSAMEELDGRANESVILHLGECTSCATQWRLARECARFIANDAATGGEVVARRRSPWVRRGWIPLAAAAAVLVVAVVGLSLLRQSSRGTIEPIYRAQAEDWLVSEIPEDAVLPRDACVLRWAAGPDGTLYDLNVTGAGLEPLVWIRGLEQPEYRIEPEVLEGLPPGAKILWRVKAQLPDERRVMSPTITTALE